MDKVVIVMILVFSEKWEVLIVHLHASDVQWFPGSNSRKVLYNSENQSGRKDFLLDLRAEIAFGSWDVTA